MDIKISIGSIYYWDAALIKFYGTIFQIWTIFSRIMDIMDIMHIMDIMASYVSELSIENVMLKYFHFEQIM